MSVYALLIEPFAAYGFMARALAACLAVAAGSAPLGVFLVLKRMALMGDALSHAILPGVALAFLLSGLALWPMTLGGLAAGLVVALAAGAVARSTKLKEDASLMAAYLIALALGVMMISLKGSAIDLMHVLFGNVLAVDAPALAMMTMVASISLLALSALYRTLILECFDPLFLRVMGGREGRAHALFLALVVLNLVAAFQALGTLMALGLMVLPAIAARLWAGSVDAAVALSMAFGAASAYIGLLISYHCSVPSGPAIVLTAGGIYALSLALSGKHSRRAFALLPLLMLLPQQSFAAEKLRVMASFSILGDMVRDVAGDEVALTTLVGPDSDAHEYQPTPADVAALSHADLVVINGLGLEHWLERLEKAARFEGKTLVASNGVTPLTAPEGGIDPHAWQDLRNGERYVAAIRDGLIAADPPHAEAYRQNAARYLASLEALDAWVVTQINQVPRPKRILITSHDAFGYFASRYGVKMLAAQGVSTESEPSAKAVAALVDQIRRHKVSALFLENISDPRMIRQLQQNGAEIGGTLYSDALSSPAGPAATYIAMFRSNVALLVAGMLKNPG